MDKTHPLVSFRTTPALEWHQHHRAGDRETETPTHAVYFKWTSTAAHTLGKLALAYKSGKFFSILLAYYQVLGTK